MGNPFSEVSADLLSLDTKDIADHSAALLNAFHLVKEKEQFHRLLDKLQTGSQHFYKPIQRNKQNLFKTNWNSTENSDAQQLTEECQLFSRRFTSWHTKGCDLPESFKQENESFHPSLKKQGKRHAANKSDLVDNLQSKV